ncbi:MAG: cytochrome c biogenesis protein CcsA [Deltaproteobacteria bacterium]|nr:cytochrome c biogenesis protein CcsA [Deltaproteobacteria bacterium]
MPILSTITLILYALASVIFVIYLFKRDDRVRKGGRILTALTLVVHFGTIGSYCVRGLHPLLGIGGILNLIAFFIALGYLTLGLRWRVGFAGAIALPLTLALVVSGQIAPRVAAAGGASAMLGKLHLVLVAMGVTALFFAAVVAVAYLRQDRALRSSQLASLDQRGPALTTLDAIGLRLIVVGAPLFLLAVVTGVLWSLRLDGAVWRVEHLLSGVILVIFAVLIVARLTVGWRGRKAALLTLSGFSLTALVLAIYVARRLLS